MQLLDFMTLGAAAALALPLTPAAGSAQDVRQRIDTTLAFDRGGSVVVGIVSGDVRVVTGTANEVRISATIERGRFETSFSRSRVSIQARSIDNRMGTTRVELTVPVGTSVRASSVSGDVTVLGTQAEVEASTTSGDVTVSDAASVARIGTVSGTVEVTRASGRVELSTVSGSVRVSEVSGDLGVEAVSARVSIQGARVRTLRVSTVSGEVTFDGPVDRTGDYRLSSHSGRVLLVLPADAAATLDLETFSGRITSDFPITLQPGENVGRRGQRMHLTLGGGGARVSAESFSGSITIRRAGSRDQDQQE